jgi:predicted Rossmann-fold nucleotide-binding protein
MYIGIIGSNESIATPQQRSFAFDVGKGLIDHGYSIINGGMGGIMSESAKGGRSSDQFQHRVGIGLLCLIVMPWLL